VAGVEYRFNELDLSRQKSQKNFKCFLSPTDELRPADAYGRRLLVAGLNSSVGDIF
jgi:hypothetical protein